MLTLYVHPTCTSCRKAVALAEESGLTFARRDYFRDRFDAGELRDVLTTAGRTPEEMLSRRAKAFKERGLEDREIGEDELIDLMVDEPTLLRRPLIVGTTGSVVGFNAGVVTAFLAAERDADAATP